VNTPTKADRRWGTATQQVALGAESPISSSGVPNWLPGQICRCFKSQSLIRRLNTPVGSGGGNFGSIARLSLGSSCVLLSLPLSLLLLVDQTVAAALHDHSGLPPDEVRTSQPRSPTTLTRSAFPRPAGHKPPREALKQSTVRPRVSASHPHDLEIQDRIVASLESLMHKERGTSKSTEICPFYL
jgi:hypothetical protein